MPRKAETDTEVNKESDAIKQAVAKSDHEDLVEQLGRMLGAVMKYISDDEIVEIDIEYLLENTKGLREWWNDFREKDRRRVENEIKKSLSSLSLEELEKIREQISERNS